MADQLQWNALSVCKDATETMARLPLLVSFCSLADEDYVEVWRVRGLHATETSAPGLYEIAVSAQCLYRSDRPFSADDFPVSEDRWRFHASNMRDEFTTGIDLAYVYIPIGGRRFRCLGRVLGLPCVVEVDTIQLPDHIIAELALGLGARCFPPSWPQAAPERYPCCDR